MKKFLAFLMFLSVGAFGQGLRDQYVCSAPMEPCIVTGPQGAYFGQMMSAPNGLWGLGYGYYSVSIGTMAFGWDSASNLYFSPYTLNASTYTAASGNFATKGAITAGGGFVGAVTGTGSLSISSSATAGQGMRFLGVLASTPTNHKVGDMYYATTIPALAISTVTYTSNAQGWLYYPLNTASSVWTSY